MGSVVCNTSLEYNKDKIVLINQYNTGSQILVLYISQVPGGSISLYQAVALSIDISLPLSCSLQMMCSTSYTRAKETVSWEKHLRWAGIPISGNYPHPPCNGKNLVGYNLYWSLGLRLTFMRVKKQTEVFIFNPLQNAVLSGLCSNARYS